MTALGLLMFSLCVVPIASAESVKASYPLKDFGRVVVESDQIDNSTQLGVPTLNEIDGNSRLSGINENYNREFNGGLGGMQNDKLVERHIELVFENEKLKVDTEKLKDDNDRLRREVDNLKEQNDNFRWMERLRYEEDQKRIREIEKERVHCKDKTCRQTPPQDTNDE